MPRPTKKRRVCCHHEGQLFGPKKAGHDRVITMPIDVYEVIRLIDYENKQQAEAAASMGVARTTVQRLYQEGRKLIAQALFEKAYLRIAGGHVTMSHTCKNIEKDVNEFMKVMVVTDEKQVAMPHGKAKHFTIFTIEDNQITHRDYLKREGHEEQGCRHFIMSLGIDALIVGGMGRRAYDRYEEAGIEVYKATGSAEEAINDYLNSKLKIIEISEHSGHEHGHGGCCHD